MPSDSLYENDFVMWTERQSAALRQAARAGSNLPLDWDNLAEEIDSVGRSERSTVESLVIQIMSHLLKLRYSPSRTTHSKWDSEIEYARDRLRRTLDMSPSLRPRLPDIVAGATRSSKRAAARSLRKYREEDAARAVESFELLLTSEQVQDDDFYLPGTIFQREDARTEPDRPEGRSALE